MLRFINKNPFAMKKKVGILCFLLTLIFIATQAQAQIDFGIRGGVNFATFNDTEFDVGTRTALLFGAYLNVPIPGSPISVQPEILYSQKGYERNGLTTEIDYIEVPVLAKFTYITDGLITPHIYFGPYMAFKVYVDQERPETIVNADGPPFPPFIGEDTVDDTDFGVVAGGGVSINRFDIGVRYSVGLTPVLEGDDRSAKNGVVSIVAGVRF